MSVDKARAFLEALQSDDSLAVRADDAYVAGLKAVAAEAGFTFSEDDLRQTLDAVGAMADEELEAVAGGGATLNTATIPAAEGITAFSGKNQLTITINGLSSFSKTGFSR